jgi:probable phosphomutase (TIGR03848 family)
MACTVFLIRHAVTAETGSVLSGRKPGIALAPEGVAQAERTAAILADVSFSACYASPIERTVQTAQIVSRPHGLDVVEDASFIEADYGKWTDVPLAELRKDPLWPVIQHNPARAVFPDGEAMRSIQQRAVDGIERLAGTHQGQAILVVSHADVIKAIVAHYLGSHLDLFQRIQISPASVSVLQLWGFGPMVACVNQRPDDEGLKGLVIPAPHADEGQTGGHDGSGAGGEA